MRVISDLLNQDLHVPFIAEVEIGTLPASKRVRFLFHTSNLKPIARNI